MSLFELFDAENVQPNERSVKTIKDAQSVFIEQRNEFQSQIDAKEIRRIEDKMLPSPNGRSRDESPMSVLTKEERLLYADYLRNMKGDEKGAISFETYVEPRNKK